MKTERNDFDPKAYNPTFQWGFLAPKHWGTWLGLLIGIPLALLPIRLQRWMVSKIINWLANKPPRTVHNIWTNLTLCFPEKNDAEKEAILRDCLTTAGVFLFNFPLITLFGQRYLERRCDIEGLEHLEAVRQQGDNVILLTPHTWAIDVLPILLAAKGSPVVAMVKQQKNPVGDWLMHRQRIQFGGRIYERSAGIKPYMKSIREGYIGYYLPDQDHGREQSLFVDFFATQKATLPGLGKLAKVSKAKVLSSFTRFNTETGRYEVRIFPAWENFPSENEHSDARQMNAFIEQQIAQYPAQYMWTFQLLRTRPDPEEQSPYYDEQLKKPTAKS
ncbi:TPA: lauroyl-Kdo(2)-lipid IV(A) myristoyltransferase [Vibrio vulnificus]|uniref:lauroyl-Kdo(2)-lipid IV(A) myristoyltransferase n=1 Tax=Vibrio sp. 05-20-BW147 TaxID=2575834 RepID=UPI00159419C2|nr:lauroyl-Kdo(2)-lipid IV(A) myristoyltransferase [Vibrio sp. 05-20-BW147]NVC64596.1 lauroyl-Kdo(2)-lipid IV(A) myristoyltransferase [Vibrio sp. 05-20-BW147]HAS6349086.1 lauroyl-Kdo(2)-lipid IV(A) myristoyltransferase [Vibrio vulnificus]